MGYKCCVPGCRSNYNGEVKKYICFSFPNDENRRKLWVSAIPRNDFNPTQYSKVCELHFKETDFETEVSAYDSKTGVVITAPLVRKRLKKGVIPSLFLPTTDSISSGEKRSLKQKNLLKTGQSNTVQNRLKWVPVKNFPLKDTSTSASRSPGNIETVGKKMVKRKRKSITNDTSNKKITNLSKLNNTHIADGIRTLEKSADESIQEAGVLKLLIKEEPLSDGDVSSVPSRNNLKESVSENVQITNIKSLSSESIAESPSEEEHLTNMPNENFDDNFYSKPLNMDERDKAFGSFVACELSDLHQNPALYMKTKQSILKILTESHFEQMSSSTNN